MNIHIPTCKKVLAGKVDELASAFLWSDTPQGHEYWEKAAEVDKLTPRQRKEIKKFIKNAEKESKEETA